MTGFRCSVFQTFFMNVHTYDQSLAGSSIKVNHASLLRKNTNKNKYISNKTKFCDYI